VNRIVKLCSIICLCACIVGCIENPGPDKALGQEKNGRVTQIVFGYLGESWGWQPYILHLELKNIGGVEYLYVENAGYSDISSADIILRITRKPYRFSLPWLPTVSHFDRNLKIKSLPQHQLIEVGPLDSITAYVGARWYLSADFLSISEPETKANWMVGGFFSGIYVSKPKIGLPFKGNMRGLVNMRGSAILFPDSGEAGNDFYLEGKIDFENFGGIKKFNGITTRMPIELDTSLVRIVGDSLYFTTIQTSNKDTMEISLIRFTPSNAIFASGR
jgi:hypothetical protein